MASNKVDDTDIISSDAATPPVSSSMKRFLRDDAKSLSDRRSLSFSSAINPSTNPKSLQRSESKQSSHSNPEVKQSVRYNPDSRKSKPADTVTSRKKKKAKSRPKPDPEVVNHECLVSYSVYEHALLTHLICSCISDQLSHPQTPIIKTIVVDQTPIRSNEMFFSLPLRCINQKIYFLAFIIQ